MSRLWLVLLMMSMGCSDSPVRSACTPGETQPCVCPVGTSAQECNAGGTGWNSCQCDAVDGADGFVAADSEPPDDAADPIEDDGRLGDLPDDPPDEGPDDPPDEGPVDPPDEGPPADVCLPHHEKKCAGDQVYWFDSCGGQESIATICADEDFCKDATCVKPFYNGTWHLTADPNKKDACGLGEATYFDQDLELVVDGSTASGTIDVLGFFVEFEGTLTGKKLFLEGTYTQDPDSFPVEHTQTIEVTFDSMTTFSGYDQDAFTLLSFPCTLYWEVTGVKK